MIYIPLRQKISISIGIVIFFFGVVISLLVFRYTKIRFTEFRKDNSIIFAQEQTHETKQQFINAKTFAKMIAVRTRLAEYFNDPSNARYVELDKIFDQYVIDNPEYLAVFLLNSAGKTVISSDKRFIGEDYSFRDYFKEGILGRPYVEARIGITSNEFGYYFAHPVTEKDKVLGVIVAKLNPSSINNSLIELAKLEDGNVMFVDNDGVILFSNRTDRIFKSLGPLSSTTQQKISSEYRYPGKNISPIQYDNAASIVRTFSKAQVIEFYDAVDQENEILSVNKVSNDLPYFLITEIETDKITAFASQVAGFISVAIVITNLLMVFFVYSLSSYLLYPLVEFKQLADKIRDGSFGQKIFLNRKDELGDLAVAFNKMSDEISLRYDTMQIEIQRQTSELSQKVSELEDVKKAMMNLLDDISNEKIVSDRQAQDLRKFQLAVENVSDHIVITDADGIVLYANKAVERVTGYSIEEIIGSKAGVKWGKLMEKSFYENLWKIIKDQKTTFSGEIQNKRNNGETYIADTQISPILDSGGTILFFVGIEHDITKVKEIDRMKTEFISLASHQLRTPLSAMKWLAEMLLVGDVGKLNNEQKECVTNIHNANERMIALVNSLLNVSRIESGRIIIDPRPTRLVELVNTVIKELEPKINKKHINITVEVSNDVPILNIDPQLTEEVYTNLLTNALKYSKAGAGIAVSITRVDDQIISKISDTGYGIPIKDQEHIFEKFYRAENIRQVETDGSGLGLYLVKAIAESSKGSISFESVEGHGTTFTFTLPISGSEAKEGVVRLSI